MIKPSFFANEQLGGLEPYARLIFIGLWCLADRRGRLEDRPLRIRAEVLPYDAHADVDDSLNQLAEAGLIQRYAAAGDRFIQVLKFEQHQYPHRNEIESRIPPPDGYASPERSRDSATDTANIEYETSIQGRPRMKPLLSKAGQRHTKAGLDTRELVPSNPVPELPDTTGPDTVPLPGTPLEPGTTGELGKTTSFPPTRKRSGSKPAPQGNSKVAAFYAKVLELDPDSYAQGIELSGQDHAELKSSTHPERIATGWVKARRGEWGSDYLQHHLTISGVKAAINAMDIKAKGGTNGKGRIQGAGRSEDRRRAATLGPHGEIEYDLANDPWAVAHGLAPKAGGPGGTPPPL